MIQFQYETSNIRTFHVTRFQYETIFLIMEAAKRKDGDESFNEKKKWQIALRRYVINKSKSAAYAPYFGIDIEGFRNWIQSQFEKSMSWDNFSKNWQFEHVLPVSYFDLSKEADLKMCWNFINIRVENLIDLNKPPKQDLNSVVHYFDAIYKHTGLLICRSLLEKIAEIQSHKTDPLPAQLDFLAAIAADISAIQNFSAYEFERLNSGDDIKTLLAEQDLIQRFG